MSAFQPSKTSLYYHLNNPHFLSLVSEISMEEPLRPYTGEERGTFFLTETDLVEEDLSRYSGRFQRIILIQSTPGEAVDVYLNAGASFVLRHDSTLKELLRALNVVINEHKHRIENTMLQNIFSKAQNSIVITDLEGSILYANDYFERITGYNFFELVGASPQLIRSGAHGDDFYRELWETIESGKVWEGVFINKRRDGQLIYEESTITPVVDEQQQIISFLKIGRSVERERLHMHQLGDEVRLAKDIVLSMQPAPYGDDTVAFVSEIKAYNYLGGDFISFEKHSEGVYRLALIDVMGHGASSTMIGLKLITMFQDYSRFYDLSQSVKEVNQMVVDFNREDAVGSKFVTGVFLEINTQEGRIDYINAGHPDVKYIDTEDQVGSLASNNLLLGVQSSFPYTYERYRMDTYKHLLLYTDGLVENAVRGYDEMEARLEKLMMMEPPKGRAYLQRILAHMTGSNEMNDDIAMCLLSFLKT